MSEPFVLSSGEIEALARGAVVRSFPKNAVVVNEGDRTDSLYLILAGKVKVFLSDEDGNEVTLGTQGAGEYFGEMVLDEGPRSASVMTLEPSRFAIVFKLISRTRALTDNVRSLALLDVYGRVARLLLELAVEQGGRRVIPEKLTQQDIASRVGASREMVSLILKDLAAGGYISVSGKTITVHREPPKHW
jgi:CRP/FNR family cyclic AMP-dependent transcriptional regulator